MGKGKVLTTIINLALWLTGIIVSLSVGFAMTNETLTLPNWLGGSVVAMTAGWIVIILTLVSIVLEIIKQVS
ncbi:MAG: hypothetical protein AABW90_03670 [Nanoarchaeota archaeon]